MYKSVAFLIGRLEIQTLSRYLAALVNDAFSVSGYGSVAALSLISIK